MTSTESPLARLARLASPRRLRAELKERRISRRTRGSPDRLFLVETILPAVARGGGTILWVGCRRYTDDYPALLEAQGAVCWTTDIDPAAAVFGSPGRHRTGDLTRIDAVFPDVRFSAILCNGVFGYGVDDPGAQRAAARAMARVATAGARLVLGWNTDKMDDPVAAGVLEPWFRRAGGFGLEGRVEIAGSTHVYDLFVGGPAAAVDEA